MIFFFFFQAEDGIRDVAVTGVQTCALPIFYRDWWGVRSKSVTIGSRLFLLRQGVEPKGIVGSGWATSAPRLRTPPEPGRINHIVDVVFDMMLDPDKYSPLDWRTFTMPPLSEVHWTTQS